MNFVRPALDAQIQNAASKARHAVLVDEFSTCFSCVDEFESCSNHAWHDNSSLHLKDKIDVHPYGQAPVLLLVSDASLADWFHSLDSRNHRATARSRVKDLRKCGIKQSKERSICSRTAPV